MNLIITPSFRLYDSAQDSDQLNMSRSLEECPSPAKSTCSIFYQNPQDSPLALDTNSYQRESLKSIKTNCTEHWQENEQETLLSDYSGQNSLQINEEKECQEFPENEFCINGHFCQKGHHEMECNDNSHIRSKRYVRMQNFPQILILKDKRVRSFLSE